jgi:hypothetical protein
MNETRYLLIEMTPPSTEIWESDTSFGSLLWLHLCKYKKLAFCVHRQQLLKKNRVRKINKLNVTAFTPRVCLDIVLSHYWITRLASGRIAYALFFGMSCVKSQVAVTASTDRPRASCCHGVYRELEMPVHMLPES